MPEVAFAGEDHRDAVFIARRDDFIISLGTPRLDDGDDPRFGCAMDRVGKGEESIRR